MTESVDLKRVQREARWQRIDEVLTFANWLVIGLAAGGLALLLGIAARAGRLTP